MELGDQKLLRKFREFCEAYNVKYAFEGVVEGFDTIDTVDPERLTRGLFVRSERDVKLVQNESKRKPPVIIGDRLIVVGRNGRHGEKSVLPAALLILKRKQMFFAKALRIGKLDEFRLNRLLYAIAVISMGFLLALMTNPTIELLGVWIILVLFVSSFSVTGYVLRPRLYSCDEDTWHALTTEIAERFGINLSAQL